MMNPWFYGGSGGFGWMGMGLGMIIQLLFWIFLIYFAIRLFRGVTLGRSSQEGNFSVMSNNRSTAKEILQQRYAKGEITREQYKEMLNDIKE